LLLHQGKLISSGNGQDLCDLSGETSLAAAFKKLTQKGTTPL
jgi:ABC-2 type transport system ATP-binding protein